MGSTLGRTHHCVGQSGPVGNIPQGGCDFHPKTHHCKTHETLCKMHPNIYFLKKPGADCYKCKQYDMAHARKEDVAARQREEDEKAAADAKDNRKVRTKPRRNKDGSGRDTGPGGADAPDAPPAI